MRRLLPALLLLLVVGEAAGQDYFDEGYGNELFIGLSYSLAVPMSSTRDFITETSFRGLALDWRKGVRPDVTVGFQVGWNGFEETSEESVTLPDSTLTGRHTRFLNAFPLQVSAHYYWGDSRGIRPFAGGGIGAYYVIQRYEQGDDSYRDDAWHFGVSPEAGVVFPIAETFNWFVLTRLHHAVGSGDDTSQTYWALNIGLATETYGF
jgi:hypothetical protein